MRTMKGLGHLAILAGSLLVLTGSKGMAQEFKGKFVLPVEARWGSADLRPGQYTLAVDSELSIPMIRVSGKDGKTKLVFATTRDTRPASEQNMLTLTNLDGKYYIRTLEAGDVGQVLTFRVSPRQTPVAAVRRKPELHLPVTGVGK